ncbi:hypothetical protein [Spirochaeta cellobiosiphila]|uniref:hypothetical protein n=1 Tax=Spirochaeta cellobiosiphila TaxID=504483 RepID=UPI00041442E7|nr:hypothetical protein [Spirochaeta cellobiosiphila]
MKSGIRKDYMLIGIIVYLLTVMWSIFLVVQMRYDKLPYEIGRSVFVLISIVLTTKNYRWAVIGFSVIYVLASVGQVIAFIVQWSTKSYIDVSSLIIALLYFNIGFYLFTTRKESSPLDETIN